MLPLFSAFSVILTTRKLRDHLLPEDGHGVIAPPWVFLSMAVTHCSTERKMFPALLFSYTHHIIPWHLFPSPAFAGRCCQHLSAEAGDKPCSPDQLLHKGQDMELSAHPLEEPTLKASEQPGHCIAFPNYLRSTVSIISSSGPNPKTFQFRQSK